MTTSGYEELLHVYTGIATTHSHSFRISRHTAGMTQRRCGEAALAAVWTMVRVSLSGVQMEELILNTQRSLKMVAAEGCVCPAGEAQ